MASIIIFSTLWGIALKEWNGAGPRTKFMVALSLATLIASTAVVGYGNYLGTHSQLVRRLKRQHLPPTSTSASPQTHNSPPAPHTPSPHLHAPHAPADSPPTPSHPAATALRNRRRQPPRRIRRNRQLPRRLPAAHAPLRPNRPILRLIRKIHRPQRIAKIRMQINRMKSRIPSHRINPRRIPINPIRHRSIRIVVVRIHARISAHLIAIPPFPHRRRAMLHQISP